METSHTGDNYILVPDHDGDDVRNKWLRKSNHPLSHLIPLHGVRSKQDLCGTLLNIAP